MDSILRGKSVLMSMPTGRFSSESFFSEWKVVWLRSKEFSYFLGHFVLIFFFFFFLLFVTPKVLTYRKESKKEHIVLK